MMAKKILALGCSVIVLAIGGSATLTGCTKAQIKEDKNSSPEQLQKDIEDVEEPVAPLIGD